MDNSYNKFKIGKQLFEAVPQLVLNFDIPDNVSKSIDSPMEVFVMARAIEQMTLAIDWVLMELRKTNNINKSESTESSEIINQIYPLYSKFMAIDEMPELVNALQLLDKKQYDEKQINRIQDAFESYPAFELYARLFPNNIEHIKDDILSGCSDDNVDADIEDQQILLYPSFFLLVLLLIRFL